MKGKTLAVSAALLICLPFLAQLVPSLSVSLWAAEPPPPATETQAQPQPPGVLSYKQIPKTGTTVLYWSGEIYPPMADYLEAAFAQFKAETKRFVLVLDSNGGSVREGESVIAVLRDLKTTHRLDTAVDAGTMCASMCPFIYAQGERRMAAPASMWMFHEVLTSDTAGNPLYLDRGLWIALVDKYFAPAGVSDRWISHLKGAVLSRDYFASGDSLLRTKTGLVTNAIKNFRVRDIPQG